MNEFELANERGERIARRNEIIRERRKFYTQARRLGLELLRGQFRKCKGYSGNEHEEIYYRTVSCPECLRRQQIVEGERRIQENKNAIEQWASRAQQNSARVDQLERQLNDQNWVLVTDRERNQINRIKTEEPKPAPTAAKEHPTLSSRVKRFFHLKDE